MITLTRGEAQNVLNLLILWLDEQEEPDTETAIEILRAKLHEYPKNKVHPYEFLKAVEGKENLIGMPIMWAEWPTKEEL